MMYNRAVPSKSVKIFIERILPRDRGNLIFYAETAECCINRFV